MLQFETDDTTAAANPETTVSDVKREANETDTGQINLVSEWQTEIEAAKTFWSEDFKRMRKNMQMARLGATKEWYDDGNFVVPIIKRHVNQITAKLYAKNPTPVAEPRERIEYTVWDGRVDSLKAAMETAASSVAMGMPPDPNTMAIIEDVSQAQIKQTLMKKICKTTVLVLRYYMDEQMPGFKKSIKQLVRRIKTCGIGYIQISYQRLLEVNPEVSRKLADVTEQLKVMEQIAADAEDQLLDDDAAELKRLQYMQQDLQTQLQIIAREGPVWDFPRSTEIIVDPKCTQLDGLINAGYYVREFRMTQKEIERNWKVDVRGSAKAYNKVKDRDGSDVWREIDKSVYSKESQFCVWNVWDKESGQTFWMCQGYPNFLVEPAAPKFPLEGFWNLVPVVFNPDEHEDEIMPFSDVHDLRHTQMEYNRSREIRRLHRQSNTPTYVAIKGRLSEEDKNKLAFKTPFAVVELAALQPNEKIEQVIQMMKPAPVDPAMYETNTEMEDLYRTVGSQEANIGGTSGATATEVSVADESATSSNDSNIDDLDDALSLTMRLTTQLMLLAMSKQTVQRIVGAGAAWPELNRQQVAEEVIMSIKAGSSGRPNAAAELAKMERAMQWLPNIDGVKLTPFAEKATELLDVNVDEAIIDGLPSQTALNSMAGKLMQAGAAGAPGAAPPSSDPNAQGPQGAANEEQPPGQAPGAQPAYPTVNYDAQGNRV